MQFSTTPSPAELREASRLLRPPNFWLKFLGASWYATLLAVIALGVIVVALVGHRQVNWTSVAILLGLAVFRFGIAWTRWRDRVEKGMAAALPGAGTRTLDPTGIRSTLVNGVTSFAPWSSYGKWIEGKSVFIVTGTGQPLILPLGDNSPDMVRGLLQSQIRPGPTAPGSIG